MKRILLLCCTFLLMPALTSALSLEITPKIAKVKAGQTLMYNLTLTTEVDDWIVMHLTGIKPWMTVDSFGFVKANTSVTKHVYVSPTYSTPVGVYKVVVTVESPRLNKTASDEFLITVVKEAYAAIEDFKIAGDYVPLGYVSLRASVVNPGIAPIENVTANIYLSNTTATLNKASYKLELAQGEKKEIVHNFTLKAGLASGRYCASMVLLYRNEPMDSATRCFSVKPAAIIKKTYERNPVFIGERVKIKVYNLGNIVAENVEVSENLGASSSFYSHIQGPKPSREGGVTTWNIRRIYPMDYAVIEYEINYAPLLVLLILIGGALWFMLYAVRVVSIEKRIIHKKKVKTGESFTVVIEIKNRVGKEIEGLVIRDLVPMIFKVNGYTGPKPRRRAVTKGTELVWRVRKLKPYEERIFSYKITSMVEVKGGFKLPRAKVFYRFMNRMRSRLSNAPDLGE